MITRVQVKNFRSLADVDVTLGPLTVLVGRNGSGKSNYLDVLRFVRDALRAGLENAVIDRHGFAAIRRWSPRKPYQVEIGLTVKTPSFWGHYALTIGSAGDGYRIKREACSVGASEQDVRGGFEREASEWVRSPEQSIGPHQQPLFSVRDSPQVSRRAPALEPTALVLPGVMAYPEFAPLGRMLRGNFYSIFPNTLRLPQKPLTERLLTDQGDNLASVLQRLRKESKYFKDLISALGRVAEGVSDLQVRHAGGFLVVELKHKDLSKTGSNGKSPWFDLSQESDGTLRMLGMLVALYQSSPHRSLLALEEPESALHPGALAVLSDVLREAARRRQIIITTQSPDLIARFRAEELRVVERSEGVTKIGPVDDMQREAIEEQLFSAGDLLRIEGLRREPVTAGDRNA